MLTEAVTLYEILSCLKLLEIRVLKGISLKGSSTQLYPEPFVYEESLFEVSVCQGCFVPLRTLFIQTAPFERKRSLRIVEILKELFHQGFFLA